MFHVLMIPAPPPPPAPVLVVEEAAIRIHCRNATFMDPAPLTRKEVALAKATEYGTQSHAAGHGCANDAPAFLEWLEATTAAIKEAKRQAATLDLLDAFNKAWQAADALAHPDPEETN